MSDEDTHLPGTPPKSLEDAYGALSPAYKRAMRRHILGGTSADVIAAWFKRTDVPVGATTVKSYRRSLKGE